MHWVFEFSFSSVFIRYPEAQELKVKKTFVGFHRGGNCHWFARVNFASELRWLGSKAWCLLIMKAEPKTGHVQIPRAQQTGVWGLKAEQRGKTR